MFDWKPPHLNFSIYSYLSGSLEVMKYSTYKLEYLQILTFRFLTVSLHCQWGEDWRVKMVRCLKEEKQKLFLQSKITRRNLLQIITKRKADTKRRFLSLFAFCFKGLLSFIIICWRREKKTSSNQYVWILSSYQDFHIFFLPQGQGHFYFSSFKIFCKQTWAHLRMWNSATFIFII